MDGARPAHKGAALARALTSTRARAAFIDVDDVRQLVVAGGEAPWRGAEGESQRGLGVLNAAGMARGFIGAHFDVVIVDVLTPRTAQMYRDELGRCVLVHLLATAEEVRRRASTRRLWLTDAEFRLLHENDRAFPPPVDHRLDVTTMSVGEQVAAVDAIWAVS